MSCVSRGGIGIAPVLHRFVNEECLKGTGIEAERFWAGLGALIRELTPVNGSLLSTRDRLQGELDRWHREHRGRIEPSSYREFLRGIGYLCDTPAECTIGTENVDPELAHIAGPQLVVPLDNARYALNAANARWGSLYDALYGTDAIDESDGAERRGAYNRVRGGKVVAFVRGFLDRHFPLTLGTHRDVVRYCIDGDGLTATLSDGGHARLERREAAVGYHASRESPSLVLLRHNGLHVELHVDRAHPIGREDSAGICDVVLESAVSSIQDCEDSVAAVDADDKIHVYRNW
ncbi:MAG: malate synthase G, partial [Steroidobacteraceae bacterium]